MGYKGAQVTGRISCPDNSSPQSINPMKKILFPLLLILGASGLAFTSACSSTATSRSTGAYIDDEAITTKIKAAYVKDDTVKAFDVHVDTYNGNVQLSGFVENAAQKMRAETIARETHGVQNVSNNIQLSPRRP
jgi:osmotically-inducible protein OsmY